MTASVRENTPSPSAAKTRFFKQTECLIRRKTFRFLSSLIQREIVIRSARHAAPEVAMSAGPPTEWPRAARAAHEGPPVREFTATTCLC